MEEHNVNVNFLLQHFSPCVNIKTSTLNNCTFNCSEFYDRSYFPNLLSLNVSHSFALNTDIAYFVEYI